MKVLWFTNIPLPDGCRAVGLQPYVKGGWMPSLANALLETSAVQLGIVSFLPKVKETKKQIGNISHYIMPVKFYKELQREPNEEAVLACKKVYDDFQPDLVHIFGTEYFYGLFSASGYIKCPVIIRLQGIIYVYLKYFFGGLSFVDILRAHSPKECLCGNGLIHSYMQLRNYANIELKILKENNFFIGTSLWDKTSLLAVNPNATYYHCDDLLRPEFYSKEWAFSKIRRHSVFVPSGSYPLKGLHTALRAIAILKKEFPNISLRVSDSPLDWYSKYKGRFSWLTEPGYAGYLRRSIKKLNIRNNVIPLGLLSGEEMAQEMSCVNAVVIPSFIENSCNALQEAQLVGAPAIAANTGGMPESIKNGGGGLLFTPGDENELAESIRRVFLDNALAMKISRDSRLAALKRNDKQTIVKTILNIYKEAQNNG